MTYIGLLIK